MDTVPSVPRDEWLRQFAHHLRPLQPLMSDSQCLELASAAFASSNDLEPDVAATVFSEIVDASVPLNDANRRLPTSD
jgi:hypothetical protein